ncbi:hypothetical protein E0E52_07670 [Azotobacter chroococcum]|nr:hypothetical protein E0E52_07670 [Azotobacter chroococcum]
MQAGFESGKTVGASDAPQTLDERFVLQTGIPMRWVGRPTWWCGKSRGLYHDGPGLPAFRPTPFKVFPFPNRFRRCEFIRDTYGFADDRRRTRSCSRLASSRPKALKGGLQVTSR